MQKMNEGHVFTGMQRDLSISKHPVQFLYDARNIRLTAREGDSLLSITNEKGTEATRVSVKGTYLGHCLLNEYLIIFSLVTSSQKSYITRINLKTLEKKELYDSTPTTNNPNRTSLGFSVNNPIEAIGSYETTVIQKVYWTDGLNQPRMINIAPVENEDNRIASYISTSFDFVQELALKEKVTITKMLGATGLFAPGVIQYAFTYYNRYGQESNIFYTSPLLYTSYKERGGSPEDKVENAFKIKISNIDNKFDFLRIYSIQRTSIDATPFVKRVQDISLEGNDGTISYTDTGFNGDSIDPIELLYKGGELITAGTIDQKDGTLFLGNLEMTRKSLTGLKSSIQANTTILTELSRNIYPTIITSDNNGTYGYSNQLTAYADEDKTKSVPCGGFKWGDIYRCGVQFQHKSGKWSEPVYIDDKEVICNTLSWPKEINELGESYHVRIPILKGRIPKSICDTLMANGYDYRKVRAVVVFPQMQDRVVVCQGVANPTMFTETKRNQDKGLYAQSSWFFRCGMDSYSHKENSKIDGSIAPAFDSPIPYTSRQVTNTEPETKIPYDPITKEIRRVEIQGDYESDNQFKVETQMPTLHSPDIEFDDRLSLMDFTGYKGRKKGKVTVKNTFSDIDIQTESPTISNSGSGFVHKSFIKESMYGIVSGLFYDDYIVDDTEDVIKGNPYQKASGKYLIYTWQGTGSLNNDINRPADKGTASAKLRKKIISNLRYAATAYSASATDFNFMDNPQLFSSNEVSILKFGTDIYQGNIDTALIPDNSDGTYFCCNGARYVASIASGQTVWEYVDAKTEFLSEAWCKTWSTDPDKDVDSGIRVWKGAPQSTIWDYKTHDPVGEKFIDLTMKKLPVRMKYKSTPHIVFRTSENLFNYALSSTKGWLPLIEVINPNIDRNTIFGGKTPDALKENTWIPCGEPKRLDDIEAGKDYVEFSYEYGDTYYQRYDCLKTYPFTKEDFNQVVEIGSFMLETRVNIDGRYDRNRGQISNINMSPQNFNLINQVYSQKDNFFSYKIQDDEFYENIKYPHQITWTKEKNAGADVDLWTNITLASNYDMDGSKGKVEELTTWKDQIFCFQNKGISNILFNSRVQIPVSDGVPIEISNSYKVDGYKYISDGIGCNDKLLVRKTPAGIYFIDSVGAHLFHIGEGLTDLSEQCNMTTWFKKNTGSIKKLVYDDINHDVYAIQNDQALCFSEKLNQFTGFYDYGAISLIETCDNSVFTIKGNNLWKMFKGSYGNFFGTDKPWNMTFVSNGQNDGLVTIDKMFTNIEFRAGVEGDGELDQVTGKFTPALPFDSLETWNEYQHGKIQLKNLSGNAAFQHDTSNGNSSLKRKFRIWRCDIPRDNAEVNPATENPMGIFRKIKHPIDRMRNPWLYLKFQKDVPSSGNLPLTEIHDIMVTYYV